MGDSKSISARKLRKRKQTGRSPAGGSGASEQSKTLSQSPLTEPASGDPEFVPSGDEESETITPPPEESLPPSKRTIRVKPTAKPIGKLAREHEADSSNPESSFPVKKKQKGRKSQSDVDEPVHVDPEKLSTSRCLIFTANC